MNRNLFRDMFSRQIGSSVTLSYRACRILENSGVVDRASAVVWVNKPSTRNIKALGAKTYYEICAGLGMAIPTKAPTTLGAKLRAAEARIAELEQIIHDMRIENSGQTAEIERLKKELNTN